MKKKNEVKTTKENVGQSRKSGKLKDWQSTEVDEIVEVDDDGNNSNGYLDSDSGSSGDTVGRSEELVFEMVEIPQKRRKLNI